MRFLIAILVLTVATSRLAADESATADRNGIKQAVERGLAILQKSAASYPNHRDCFSCHHQTLPILAMVTARSAGVSVDEALVQSQAKFTHGSFADRHEQLEKAKGIGGRAMTVAYGLWTLDLADWQPDETTRAMVTYLLKSQQEAGHWVPQTSRPPLEESHVSCTVLAAYGMDQYAADAQRPQVDEAVARAKTWLDTAPLESQEDRNGRLWGLHLLDGTADALTAARKAVLDAQHEDGGWSQLPSMPSDAYATGQTLSLLQETGTATTDEAYRRGIGYLLKTAHDDGSWFVKTRSKPIQRFFDNGDPHGEHQFISISATSWAVTALAAAIADQPNTPAPPNAHNKGEAPLFAGKLQCLVKAWNVGDRLGWVDLEEWNYVSRGCQTALDSHDHRLAGRHGRARAAGR